MSWFPIPRAAFVRAAVTGLLAALLVLVAIACLALLVTECRVERSAAGLTIVVDHSGAP